MPLLTLKDIHLAYGHWPLLAGADFTLDAGERVGLIGRNGTGKSSLLKVISGVATADDGERTARSDVRIALVAQEPLLDASATIFEAVSEGIALARDLRRRYEMASAGQSGESLGDLQSALEHAQAWTWEQRVDAALSHLGLDGARRVGDLSGGLKKRVALAQALVNAPDVLLLDEPTNHLDMDAISWLEELLHGYAGAIIFITHDRAFLDNVATRIVELDRGKLHSYPGNFAAYENQKAQQLAFESVVNAKSDKLLAQEEVWIRKGVEARRTRSASRIARLEALRSARAQRRVTLGHVRLEVDAGVKSGKLVAEMTGVDKSYGNTRICHGLTLTVLRGDKLGLIGGNGTGKTTLLRMLLGEETPNSGQVRRGTNLSVAYFDQLRNGLDLNATLADFISPGSEWIEIGGKRKHVMSYLGDFLFPPERAQAPVSTLSGGERNRLLLARLFARPANVLVLDEPTNDLDIDTLELLEQLLADYPGTVFIVSHDRRFLDNVVTSLLVAEGNGKWQEYEGGIADWHAQRALAPTTKPDVRANVALAAATLPTAQPNVPVGGKAKLSFSEKRELEKLPDEIDALETEQATINATLADGKIYRTDGLAAKALAERLPKIEALLLEKMARWEALAARA